MSLLFFVAVVVVVFYNQVFYNFSFVVVAVVDTFAVVVFAGIERCYLVVAVVVKLEAFLLICQKI